MRAQRLNRRPAGRYIMKGRTGPYAATLRACLMACLAAAPLFAAPSLAAPAPTPAAGAPLAITTTLVALDPSDPGATPTAPDGHSWLSYRGGLILSSSDPRFGGLSGLLISNDGGTLIAVSDAGYWLTAQLSYEAGALTGLSGARIAPLLDTEGQPVAGSKRRGDAEALTRLADGRLAVAFERDHRVWAYDFTAFGVAARAEPVPISADLADAVNNKGLEALSTLPDGSLLAITEATRTPQGHIRGWRVTGAASRPVHLARIAPFDLTDMALLPSGYLLTLERRYSRVGGVGAQMRLIDPTGADPTGPDPTGAGPLAGAIIYRSKAGQTIDNMEGLAVRTAPPARTLIYAVSDDNFNPLQRTVLLMFELTATP